MGAFPKRIFLFVVAAVCLALALSAAHGYWTLSQFREEYLRNQANDIALDLDRRTRGPGMGGPGLRGNPAFWQQEFDAAIGDYEGSVAFLALVDETGAWLAGAGVDPSGVAGFRPGFAAVGGRETYIVDSPLGRSRPGRDTRGAQYGQRQLRIGVYASVADFIRAQGRPHLVVSGAAIAVLVVLSTFFLRTLRRFLELQAREESARHLAALGAMAATLAHEIRNPLGAMKGLTQLAQEDLPREHQAQQFMTTVVSEAERLERLVTDLLAFARPKVPDLHDFDLPALIGELKQQLLTRPESAGRGIEIDSTSDSLRVHSDPSGLRQVLLNILLNALDATPGGGRVRVVVKPCPAEGMFAVVVDDDGPGLGGGNPEELFAPFVTTKTRGSGLGLPVSRRIAETLGGTLSLANRSGGGARCTLILPLRTEPGGGSGQV
ncbi:MAG: ATP-binding protein [Acidobacteriota bacterium]